MLPLRRQCGLLQYFKLCVVAAVQAREPGLDASILLSRGFILFAK